MSENDNRQGGSVGIALGQALLLFGLLLLAWVVYTQQEEIALLAEAVGRTGTAPAKAAGVDGMAPVPVAGAAPPVVTPPVEGPEVPVNAPPPPPPPTPPTFEWPPGSVGSGPAS